MSIYDRPQSHVVTTVCPLQFVDFTIVGLWQQRRIFRIGSIKQTNLKFRFITVTIVYCLNLKFTCPSQVPYAKQFSCEGLKARREIRPRNLRLNSIILIYCRCGRLKSQVLMVPLPNPIASLKTTQIKLMHIAKININKFKTRVFTCLD